MLTSSDSLSKIFLFRNDFGVLFSTLSGDGAYESTSHLLFKLRLESLTQSTTGNLLFLKWYSTKPAIKASNFSSPTKGAGVMERARHISLFASYSRSLSSKKIRKAIS